MAKAQFIHQAIGDSFFLKQIVKQQPQSTRAIAENWHFFIKSLDHLNKLDPCFFGAN